MKNLIIGTVAGGIVFFFLGYLFYGMLLADFFQSNLGSATGVMKEPVDFVHLFLGCLAGGCLLTYIFDKWANIRTLSTGLKAGAILGLMAGLQWDLIGFGTSNVMNITGTLADVVVYTVMSAIVGGVIGWAIGQFGGSE